MQQKDHFSITYSPGAGYSAWRAGMGRALTGVLECAASQACQAGHQEPSKDSAVASHSSMLSHWLPLGWVRRR